MVKSLIPAVCALLLVGCFDMPSVQPLYSDDILVQEPLLVGLWQTAEAKEQLMVMRTGDRKYRAVFVNDEGKATSYEVRVVKLGDAKIADLLPAEDCTYIPGHSFAKIVVDEKSLKVLFLDSDSLRQKAMGEKLGTRFGKKQVALTVPTPVLQAFIKKNLAGEEKPDYNATFQRVK